MCWTDPFSLVGLGSKRRFALLVVVVPTSRLLPVFRIRVPVYRSINVSCKSVWSCLLGRRELPATRTTIIRPGLTVTPTEGWIMLASISSSNLAFTACFDSNACAGMLASRQEVVLATKLRISLNGFEINKAMNPTSYSCFYVKLWSLLSDHKGSVGDKPVLYPELYEPLPVSVHPLGHGSDLTKTYPHFELKAERNHSGNSLELFGKTTLVFDNEGTCSNYFIGRELNQRENLDALPSRTPQGSTNTGIVTIF